MNMKTMSELSERKIEIVKRHRQIRDEMQLSPLEGIHWLPKLGSIMTNFGPEDRQQFESYVRKLIEDGVPQVSHTTAEDCYSRDDSHTAYPFWHVQGVPSKQGIPAAKAWMKARGLDWDGGAKSLRVEVERALIANETVPQFGLLIRLAIFVKDPR